MPIMCTLEMNISTMVQHHQHFALAPWHALGMFLK
jgi:hypothetical protein